MYPAILRDGIVSGDGPALNDKQVKLMDVTEFEELVKVKPQQKTLDIKGFLEFSNLIIVSNSTLAAVWQ